MFSTSAMKLFWIVTALPPVIAIPQALRPLVLLERTVVILFKDIKPEGAAVVIVIPLQLELFA
jgi:hypothetical protein